MSYNNEQYIQMAQVISRHREWAFDKFYRGRSGDVPNRHQREFQSAWNAVFDLAVSVSAMFLQDNPSFDAERWFLQAGYLPERAHEAVAKAISMVKVAEVK